jgi:predicted ester cyclase
MSVEENKAIVRHDNEEIWNQGNLDVIDEIIHPDFVCGNIRGRDGYRKWLASVWDTFPDMKQVIEHLIAEGDMVALRILATGTPKSEFVGLPPTGKQVRWTVTGLCRIAEGMIAELWFDWSGLGVYRQLGGILTKGESEE